MNSLKSRLLTTYHCLLNGARKCEIYQLKAELESHDRSMKGIFLRIDVFSHQERTIERLKEQRDRDEREKQEEIDNYKKDLKDLKEKVSLLQGDLSEKEVKITKIE